MASRKITFDNFHLDTIADFKKIKEKDIPNREPDFISDYNSKYWYEGDYIIRQSDHWDVLEKCTWMLDGSTHQGLTQGKCKLSDFKNKEYYNKLYKDHHEVWDKLDIIEKEISETNCDKLSKEIVLMWDEDLKEHFEEEEKEFFPTVFDKNKKVVSELIDEHKEIIDLIEKIKKGNKKSDIVYFCKLMKSHIKKEEVLMSEITPDIYSEEIIKILYLHGLGATPESDHVHVIDNDNLDIICLHLDYKKEPLFKYLSKIIEDEKPDGIVGHSMGGYLAYYLSNKYDIPCLMFNPSFGYKDNKLQPIPDSVKKIKPFNNQMAVVGSEDKDVPAKNQLEILEKSGSEIFIEKIGHDIPDNIKLKYFKKFIKSIDANTNLFVAKSNHYFEYVPLEEIEKYKEFDREVEYKVDKKYLDEITEKIKISGITFPIELQIDSKGKGLVVEGNHRIAVSKRLGIKYIPVRVNFRDFGSINKHKAKKLPEISIADRGRRYKELIDLGIFDESAYVNGFTKIEPKNEIFKDGGELNKEIYKKWKSLVNMSKSELEKFYNSQEGKDAGITPSEAKEKGIDSGRESARWIMKMKDTPVSEWTPDMWRWAKKQISFISRMSGNKGGLYDDKGNKTRKHTSLLIWGHNPEKDKKELGGSLSDKLSISDVEKYLGRELHWWNDDTVKINGNKYGKIFLQPFYKIIK